MRTTQIFAIWRIAVAASLIGAVFVPDTHLSAQSYPIEQQYHPYEIEQINSDLVKITIPETGEKIYKRTSDGKTINESYDVPKLILDVETIDYHYYSDRYTYWQDIHIWDPHEMLVTDTDQDGMTELIGFRSYTHKTVPEGDTLWYDVIYELSSEGGFVEMHKYPNSTSIPWWSGDLDNDGNMEVLVKKNVFYEQSNSHGQILQNYESPSPNSLATEHNFDVPLTRLTQPNHVTVIDIDDDGKTDMLYYLDGGVANVESCPNATHIAEYDRASNSFVEKFCFMQDAFYTSNYAVADLDLDGHLEFATGGLDGELYILEATGDDTYDLVCEDTLNTLNMYMCTITNDMNWNGKPELWMGGDRTKGGVESLTNIYCLEANGDNSYEIIFEIEMPDVFTFVWQGIAATDINQDGIDELLIWVADHIFILKGSGSMPTEVLYAMKNVYAYDPPYYAHKSATSKDLDGDGYPELLLSMAEGENYEYKLYTRIFRPSGPLLSTEPPTMPESFNLVKAFPNPFNASIQVEWEGLVSGIERIEIYSITGHPIRSKTFHGNNIKRTGTFIWDAKTNNGEEVNSGVYLAKLTGDAVDHVIKLSLLK
ncbi:MAG: T9SS type A sorting domain-containing protein [Candidatus Marinimicrobia bacterium]|nr:T9SS type A sorting domain-containing protein [Candidatus Neomarinimicrobiota bacterium]MCF7851454.1 T9SS type A sorting domain-containing protein [Candidatus Neomarinimicrobiota bacterium]MCF7904105.1 T9SS type A sorting domain-containing protein [Candidatus Neomarinimicrobiota bacterium]